MEQTDKDKIVENELIKVAKGLFQQYGFVKTTMEDIAKTARKSKTTLYECFKNKEEVLEGVIAVEIQEVYSIVIRENKKGKTSTKRLRIYMKTVLTEAKKRLFLYALMRGELRAQLLSFGKIKKEIDTIEIDEVKNILRSGVVLGEFSSKYKDSIPAVAYYITTATRGLMLQLVIDPDINPDLDNEQNFDMMVDLLIRGLQS